MLVSEDAPKTNGRERDIVGCSQEASADSMETRGEDEEQGCGGRRLVVAGHRTDSSRRHDLGLRSWIIDGAACDSSDGCPRAHSQEHAQESHSHQKAQLWQQEQGRAAEGKQCVAARRQHGVTSRLGQREARRPAGVADAPRERVDAHHIQPLFDGVVISDVPESEFQLEIVLLAEVPEA